MARQPTNKQPSKLPNSKVAPQKALGSSPLQQAMTEAKPRRALRTGRGGKVVRP